MTNQPTRLQFTLLAIAAIATALTGVYMRVELLTPESWQDDGSLYSRLHGAHLLWAYFGLCLPLPTAVVSLARRLRSSGGDRGSGGASVDFGSGRVGDAMLRAGALCHVAATLALTVPFFADAGSQLGLIGIPLMTLGVLFYGGGIIVRAVGSPGNLRSVPFAAMCVSLLAAIVWAVPCAVAVIAGGLSDDWSWLLEVVAPLFDVGVYAMVAPAAVALVWELLARAVAGLGTSRSGTATARLGLAIMLIALVALAAAAKLFLVFGEAEIHLSDSYWTVGIAHGLLGGPVIVSLAWWVMPNPSSRAVVWLLLVSGAVLVGATTLDLIVGLYGMPKGYHEYLPEFQGRHMAAGAAWLAFMVLFLAAMVSIARQRRATITGNEFS